MKERESTRISRNRQINTPPVDPQTEKGQENLIGKRNFLSPTHSLVVHPLLLLIKTAQNKLDLRRLPAAAALVVDWLVAKELHLIIATFRSQEGHTLEMYVK